MGIVLFYMSFPSSSQYFNKINAKLWKDDSCKAMQSRFIISPASFESCQLRCNYRFQNHDMATLKWFSAVNLQSVYGVC